MWILDKYGAAINLEKMIILRCDSEHAPFRVEAWAELDENDDRFFFLADFETRDEAKAYIADLVKKMNYPKTRPTIADFLAALKCINRELHFILDCASTPTGDNLDVRDKVISETKDLINYVEALAIQIDLET